MPTERRRIIFSDDEVVAAALAHCRTAGIPTPDADVETADLALDGDCGVELTFAVSSPELSDQVSLNGDTVVAALISFCRIRSIPLPKAASKRLEEKDGALSMVFDMCGDRGSVNCTLAA